MGGLQIPIVTFQVTVPGKIIFNQEVALDFMWINKRPVLHVICTQTHFSPAIFLTSESAEAAWLTFEGIWAMIYIHWISRRLPVRSRISIHVRKMDPVLQDSWHLDQVFRCSKPQFLRSGRKNTMRRSAQYTKKSLKHLLYRRPLPSVPQ